MGHIETVQTMKGSEFAAIIAERDRLKEEKRELVEWLEMALAWIDAVPPNTPLPTMPGFDRDVIDRMILKARQRL